MGLWIPGGLKGDDGGSSYTPPSWSEGTDEEIVEALEKHYNDEIDLTEYWSIGDERVVHLDAIDGSKANCQSQAAQDITLVLTEIGGMTLNTPINGHTTCVFQVDQKDESNEKGWINNTSSNAGGWVSSKRFLWCTYYYNAFPSTIKPIFKQFKVKSGTGSSSASGTSEAIGYFALRAEIEVYGAVASSVSGEGTYITYYKTASNRIKKNSGTAYRYWLRSPQKSNNTNFITMESNGSLSRFSANTAYGIAPFGCI